VLVAGSLVAIHLEADFTSERPQAKEGTKSWGRVLSGPLFSLPWLAIYVVSGLDKRFSWSPRWTAVAWVALILAGLGHSLAVWAMASNRFYGRHVRIQTDRGHTVVQSGPYRYVRHPGYTGPCVSMPASALALESLWALIPASLIAVVLAIRTALEDRTLQAELPGYAEHALKARFRLLPGVW
jgi:protein-S-isoprenylcysteine O-methyltransferase Ste14